ncbi:hypothetical protein [Alkalicoccus chagannorensis]|uniref:hypothetical protein n=1 Tax=Alkalicoccus chagannorensis TaxID=427072 RepID=UPI00041A5874|nr:hypothetical protein [Alkalicoccus chagannorensis]
MHTEFLLQRLFLSSETEAAADATDVQPDDIVDLRAEAEAPVPGAEAIHGVHSFALINGGPTDPAEVRRAARFILGQLKEDKRVLLH